MVICIILIGIALYVKFCITVIVEDSLVKESISIRSCSCNFLDEFDGTLELCGRACGNQMASLPGTSVQCLGLAGYLPRVAGPPLP